VPEIEINQKAIQSQIPQKKPIDRLLKVRQASPKLNKERPSVNRILQHAWLTRLLEAKYFSGNESAADATG
jgi:hypothetical protein